MNIAGVKVKVYDDEKCIYEHEAARSNESGLKTLLGDLQNIQSKVNAFLTALIEQRDASGGARSTLKSATSSDDESPSDDEWKAEADKVEVNPKKCKLST